jgi:predicted DNA-binding transcriptional regulator AlpA
MTSRSNKLMRVSEVADLLGVSKSYVYKLAQTDSSFPQPIVLGSEYNRRSASRWVLEEIEDWVNQRPRGKDYDTEQ